MCYHISTPKKKELEELAKQQEWTFDDQDYHPYYHVAGFSHPVMPAALSTEPTKIQTATWGFIPKCFSQEKALEYWKTGYSLNAKSETVFTQGLYKSAAAHHRCLLFVDGFYEWKHEGKEKIPHYIQMPDHEVFALGGIFNPWLDEESGEELITCSILTTAANELMATIHNSKKRMPLILPRKSWDTWLDPKASQEQVKQVMIPFPEKRLQANEISRLITTRGADTNISKVQSL